MEVVLGLCTDGVQAFPRVPPFAGAVPPRLGRRAAIHVILLLWLDTDYLGESTDEERKKITKKNGGGVKYLWIWALRILGIIWL